MVATKQKVVPLTYMEAQHRGTGKNPIAGMPRELLAAKDDLLIHLRAATEQIKVFTKDPELTRKWLININDAEVVTRHQTTIKEILKATKDAKALRDEAIEKFSDMSGVDQEEELFRCMDYVQNFQSQTVTINNLSILLIADVESFLIFAKEHSDE